MSQFLRETIKTFCVIALMVGSISAGLSWVQNMPTTFDWVCRIGGPFLSVLAIAIFLRIEFIPDGVPDYLRRIKWRHFNRDGFCFVIVPTADEGIAYFDLFFQSQFSGPSIATVVMRPARGFFLIRRKIPLITFKVECPPGAFGFVRLPIPVPEKFQGKKQRFEIGASVEYPEGQGEQIRFDQNGRIISANTDFFDFAGTAVTFVALATGNIQWPSHVIAKIKLPKNVSDSPPGMTPVLNVLWQLGDSELQFGNVGR